MSLRPDTEKILPLESMCPVVSVGLALVENGTDPNLIVTIVQQMRKETDKLAAIEREDWLAGLDDRIKSSKIGSG